jgi:integrase
MSLVVVKEPDNRRKDYINRSIRNEPREGVLFRDFVIKTITKKAKRMGVSYTKNYMTLIHHLDQFSQKFKATIYTNSINEDFLDDFIVYLESCDLKSGYIKTILTLTKAMIKKAGQYGYAVDYTYDDVDVISGDPFSVYLSMNDVARIYYFHGLTLKQERIRDLFVIGCLTAMRYSDYSTLNSDNFQGDYIVKITKKTRKKVVVPIHDFIKEIYQKYDNSVPTGITIQHFNRYIKIICRKIGIIEPITHSYIRGGKLITQTNKKWELISSHTARRSGATNMYLTGRLNTYEIMSLTGHTTEKSFFRYIRITDENKAKQISNDIYFKR